MGIKAVRILKIGDAEDTEEIYLTDVSTEEEREFVGLELMSFRKEKLGISGG